MYQGDREHSRAYCQTERSDILIRQSFLFIKFGRGFRSEKNWFRSPRIKIILLVVTVSTFHLHIPFEQIEIKKKASVTTFYDPGARPSYD